MKQIVKHASLGFGGLALVLAVGCTKLGQQDPYAEKSDAIRNGIPPTNTEVKQPKPLPSDVLRVQAADFLSFKEGEEGHFTPGGQVLIPVNGQDAQYGQDYSLEIVNFADFPGANWDAKTATMTWKPEIGFVNKEYTRNMRMLVRLNFTAQVPAMVAEREIKVFVTRAEHDPEITSVEDLSGQWTREGERRKFKVTVKDPDSLDKDKMRPRIMVVSVNQGALNAANLVHESKPNYGDTNPVQDRKDPTLWIYTMVLDLIDADGSPREVTKGIDTFQFGLVAANRFGEGTAPVVVNAPIVTTLREAQISWLLKNPIEIIAGQENTFTFSVYDPYGEANIEVTPDRCDLLPGQASCSCIPQNIDNTAALCTVRWNPPATEIGHTIDVSGQIYTKTKVRGDTLPAKVTPFLRRVKVMAPPTPGPTATPTPTPYPLTNGGNV